MEAGKRMKRWTVLTYLAGGLFLCAVVVLLVAQSEAADVIITDSNPEIIFDDSDNGDDWRIFTNHNVDGFGLGSIWRLFKGGGTAVIDIRGDEETYSTNLQGSLLIDSAGNLHFADDGMIFDRFNTRLGIGLTTPGYTLDAIGNRIRLRNSTAAGAKSIQMRTDGTWIDLQAANSHLLISTGSADNIYLSSGKVGVGTSSPFYKFSVSGGNSNRSTLHFTNTGTDAGGWLTSVADNNFWVSSGAMWDQAAGGWVQKSSDQLAVMAGSGPSGYRVITRSGCPVNTVCSPMTRMTIDYSGRVGLGVTPAHPLHLAGGAYSDGATWVNFSSRESKDNIRDLTTEEALSAFQGLNPVAFTYKAGEGEQHIGFIAEDVPELVATKDRKGLRPMDIVAVLTKVVQELKTENETMKQRLLLLEGKAIGPK